MRFWAIALVLLGIGAVVSGQDVPNLKEDTRLQAQLTIREPLIPLRDLVLRIREATGAPLAVAPEIADDKVCVLVADKPAYEVLTRVAELLRCQWQWGVDGTT
ncbi:MAG: hypothetical protein NZ874_01840, partial [Fimbriimonadales bacterium]|nr:hypothetical protein [Fimbriimonadales bacterium]